MEYVQNVIKRWNKKFLFFSFAAFGVSGVFGQMTTPPPAVLPEFVFQGAGGRMVTAADMPKGKAVLIAFVDVECEHCQQVVRHMNDSVALFGRVKLYFVSMAPADRLAGFARKYGPRLTFAEWLRDPDARYMVKFHPVRYPSLFLYSADKRLLDYEDNVETIFRIERTIRTLRGV
jgi:peroxiredoxin